MGKKQKIIGVLGGMGPQASAEFYRLLVEKSSIHYGAKNNDDYPEILIDSIPVPDFIENTESLEIARSMLVNRVKRMNRYGVDQICIACNTAHLLLKNLQSVSECPFISIIDAVHKKIKQLGLSRVGLLATPTTYRFHIFKSFASDVELIYPDSEIQNQTEDIILKVLEGRDPSELRNTLSSIVSQFIQKEKIQGVILGCTELPLVYLFNAQFPAINSLEVLAETVLEKYYRKEQI